MFYLGEERIVPASHLRGHSHSWWGRQECSLAVGVSLSHHLCTQEAKRKMGSWQGQVGDVTVKIHTLHWLISSVRALFSKGSTASTNNTTYWKASIPTHESVGTFHIHGDLAKAFSRFFSRGCRLFSLKNLHLWCVLFIYFCFVLGQEHHPISFTYNNHFIDVELHGRDL